MKNKKYDRYLNLIIGMGYQILSLLINLVSKNAVRTYLDLDYLGMQTVFSNFCDLFTFAFAGIGMGVLFSLYKPIEEGDRKEICGIYRYYDKIYRKITGAVIVIGTGAAGIVAVSVNADISHLEVIGAYMLYLFSVIVFNRFLVMQYFIIANQKRYVVCIICGAIDLTALAGEVFILFSTGNYMYFVLCILIKNIFIDGSLYLYLKRNYEYLFQIKETTDPGDRENINKNVKDLMIYRIGNVMLNSTDSILISVLINTGMSGMYSNYLFVSMGAHSLAAGFYESIVSQIGKLIATHSRERQFESFCRVSFMGMWLNGLLTAGFYFLIQDFIILWMGKEALLSPEIVGLVTLNIYLDGIRRATGAYRQSAGIFHKVGWVVIIRGVLNLILSVIMGEIMGLTGILAATAISNLCTLFWYEPYLLYRYFHKSFAWELLYQLAGAGSICLCLAAGRVVMRMDGSTWGSLFLKGIACFGVINFVYLGLAALMILGKRVRKARN